MLDFGKQFVVRGFLFVALKIIAVRTKVPGFLGVDENLVIFLQTFMLVSGRF